MDTNDLIHRFSFHPATTAERQNTHETIRGMCKDLALNLNDILPDGREKSLAITKLEEVMFWANAAAARQ